MLIPVISYLVSDSYLQGIVIIFFMKKIRVTIFMPFEALEAGMWPTVRSISQALIPVMPTHQGL
jgi:hypothetical protein